MNVFKGKCGHKGFTLIEVMTAVVILMLATQFLALGISFSVRMNMKDRRVSRAVASLAEDIQDDGTGINGEFSLTVGDEVIERNGLVYWEPTEGTGGDSSVWGLWIEEPTPEERERLGRSEE